MTCHKKKKKKILIDTSIQIERFKNPAVEDKLLELKNEGKVLYASFFVLYEFKTGFIKNLIDFYYEVKLYGSSDAMARWSDKWGREPKDLAILCSLISRNYKSIIVSKPEKFLLQIEWAIFYCLNSFYDSIEKYPVGNFRNDEIVNVKVEGRKDFKNFSDLYNARECIPLDSFWKKYKKELSLLLSDKNFEKKYKKMYRKLLQIKNDFNAANKLRINKGVGDAVISVDCPKTFSVNSFDKSFGFLCPVIDKEVEIFLKPSFIKNNI